MTITQDMIDRVRADFPLITEDVAYLDNSATSQKPQSVIEAGKRFYETENANPLRGLYRLSVAATETYEQAREAVRAFIGAGSTEEIIFTRNATESLNLVAYSWALDNLKAGDDILVTVIEHHSNMLPWQMAAKKTGANLHYLYPDKTGAVTEEMFRNALTPETKLVCMTQLSNVLGRSYDLRTYVKIAHEAGAVFVGDGAQSTPHIPVNVTDLDVDFFAFSGHKMLAPMGIGVLYGKKALLERMQPFLRGGEMIDYVTTEGAVWAELPHKFEAGTVNAGGAAGLLAAIEYYQKLGWAFIEQRELELTRYAMEQMKDVPHVTLLGSDRPEEHHGILTFKVDGVHPHDIAAMMDEDGVCVRAGHHCAQPLLKYLGVPNTTRCSLAFYNTEAEIDRFTASLATLRSRMGYQD